MEWLVTHALVALLVPPGGLLLLAAAAAVLARWRPRLGRALLGVSLAALYALSTPVVGDALLGSLEPPPRDPRADAGGAAIVVLGGGTYFAAPEYRGEDTVNDHTLVRLRYAAQLHRALGKPLLVTGGAPAGSAVPEARQMAQVLRGEFNVPVQWVEPRSRNTLENARLSARLLQGTGIVRVYLVTHAWHLPRARLAFERAGFAVIPAPTGYRTRFGLTVLDFLPDATALLHSRHFFRELLGIGWYHLRFLTG